MYLKELRINGFKSFAEPTKLVFGPGMIAIVGPNGCGKSNIADAIRWVLGEQSSKSLRAGSMEDVIFQGTTNRKPLGLCEVSLLFTDCEKQLGTEFKEVEVARRVTRGGGSDYYINGKLSRLRDLQRLFLDTGIGTVSYSFMLQGQIDKVISSNPAERRLIFEEAAGISKYKAQRREALSKLAIVDTNLARVTDVMEEVARQSGSLKRQAAKALRYKRIKHRLTHLDLCWAAHENKRQREELRKLESEAAVLRNKIQSQKEKLETGEARLAAARERQNAISTELNEAQQTIFTLRSEMEMAQNQAQMNEVRAADQEKRIEQIREEINQLEHRRQELEARAAGEAMTRQEQLKLFGDSDDVFRERQKALDEVQRLLSTVEATLQNKKQAILMQESSLTRLRSNCTTLEVDLKTYQVRHANLTEELQRLTNEEQAQDEALAQIVATFAVREQERTQSEAAIKDAQADEVKARDNFRLIQADIQKVDRELARVGAQIGVLEQLQEKLEGFGEGAKAILKGQLGSTLPADAYKVIAKHLRVEDPSQTAALETLLGTALDAIALEDMALAKPVAAELDAKRLGRVCLQVPAPGRAPRINTDLPSFLTEASSCVTTEDEKLSGLVSNLLSGCFFAASLSEFLTFWEANPDFEFTLVATNAGELVDRRGLIYCGRAAKSGQQSSFLQRGNEIKKLKKEQKQHQDAIAELRMKAQHAQDALDAAGRAVEEKRKRAGEIAQEVTTLRTQEKSARLALDQLRMRATQRKNDLIGLDKGKTDSEQRLEKAKADLALGEGKLEELRSVLTEAETEVARLRDERDAQRERFNEVRLEISEKRQKLAIIDKGIVDLERQKQEVVITRTRRLQEIDNLREQIGQLKNQAKIQREKADELNSRITLTRQTLESRKADLAAAQEQIKEIEGSLSGVREAVDKDGAELNQKELRLTRLQAELDFLTQNTTREYQVELSEIDWRRELWMAGDELPERIRVEIEEDDSAPAEETAPMERPEPTAEDLANIAEPDWAQLQDEAKSLRSRLNAIGPVNLSAIEEYKELRERHSFLKAQSDDLWRSKEKLVAAIDEINQTSQKLFRETFEQIRKNFSYTFETLFGGGSADLQLVDNEDVLESGIEITARPPGTRLRNLGLLSGGQKTMTAVALLFAIYMVKPSPLCVLDEIDAPLDDANIGRFCEMVKKFQAYSQFVVITHSKRTISNANQIFGATMQERGVTRVISMQFNEAVAAVEN